MVSSGKSLIGFLFCLSVCFVHYIPHLSGAVLISLASFTWCGPLPLHRTVVGAFISKRGKLL